MKNPVFAVSLIFATLTPIATFAQQNMQWTYDRYIQPSVYETSLSLTYGIPQTDAIQFSAHCVFGANAPFVRVLMGADVSNQQTGAVVPLQVAGDGYNQAFNAEVVRLEEFIYGVDFPVATDDRFIRALAAQSVLSYAVTGQQAQTLSLRGSAGPVRSFAADCANILGISRREARRNRQADSKPGDFGCDAFPGLRSQNSNTPQQATFTNRSDGYRGVLWLDFDGNPVDYAGLNQGESVSIDSFLTHPWMITDGPGNCLQIVHLQQGIGRYDLTAPGHFFGDE